MGNNIFLWPDWWHPDGVLIHKYGPRIIYDAASNSYARVSSALKGENVFKACKGQTIWCLVCCPLVIQIRQCGSPQNLHITQVQRLGNILEPKFQL
jgi:hypothetical protein